MTSPTEEQVALRELGRTQEYFESLSKTLQGLGDHWWCEAHDVIAEFLPILSAPRGSEEMREIVGMQIRQCRDCARNYHASVNDWCRSSHVSEVDKKSARAILLDWDIERLLPSLAESIRNWRRAQALPGANAWNSERAQRLRDECESAFVELLLDARLTMRKDVAVAIGELFAVLTPLSNLKKGDATLTDSRSGICIPGIYVLCFHSAPAVRCWALRCASSHSFDVIEEEGSDTFYEALPCGLSILLSSCIRDLENVFVSGGEEVVVDLTREDDGDVDDEILGWSATYGCDFPTLWVSSAAVLGRINSLAMMRWVQRRHASFLNILVHCLCETQDHIVSSASAILSHALAVLRDDFWSFEVDILPVSVAESAVTLLLSDTWDEDAKEGALLVFAPLLRSMGSSSRSNVVNVVTLLCDVLFELSVLSSVGVSPSQPFHRSQSARVGGNQKKPLLVKAARKTLAELICVCYEHYSFTVPSLGSQRIANLIANMLSESGSGSPWAAHALRLILKFDAANVVRVLTSFEVSSVALDACPTHSTAGRDTAATQAGAEELAKVSSCEVSDGGESDEGDNVLALPVSMDCDSLFVNSRFSWSEGVWESLLKGRFRVARANPGDRPDRPVSWPECIVLLDVHALIGMLDTPACDMSVKTARQRMRIFSTDTGSELSSRDAELRSASVDMAFVSMMTAVTQQLMRSESNLIKQLRPEEWLELLPRAAGHLMISPSKDIRLKTFTLLKSRTSMAKSPAGPDRGSFANIIVMRNVLELPDSGGCVLRGTGDAASMISIYGPQYAFRCYLHMIRWAEQLLTSGVTIVSDFLLDKGQVQISCMVEQFIQAWEDQKKQRPLLFGEAMARFLTVLGSIWRYLIEGGDSFRKEQKHERLLEKLLLLETCDDASVQAKWASLIAKVVTKYGVSSDQRAHFAQLLQSSAKSPCVLFAGPARLLCDALEILPVRFPRPVQNNVAVPTVVRTVPIPEPSMYNGIPSNNAGDSITASAGSRPSSFAERAVRAAILEREERAHEASRLKGIQRRLSLPNRTSGQQASAEEMLNHGRLGISGRRQQVSGKRHAKSRPVRSRRPKVVEKGPTKFAKQVAACRAARELKEKERSENGGRSVSGESSQISVVDDAKATSGLVTTSVKPSPSSIGTVRNAALHRGGNIAFEKKSEEPSIIETEAKALPRAAARNAIASARRDLKKRNIESFHGLLVNCDVDAVLDEQRERPRPRPRPEHFTTAEEYVQYWETLLFEELCAQLQQALERERSIAKQSPHNASMTSAATKWSCRTPFEIVTPAVLDPSGCYKLLTVKYCGGGFLRDSAGPVLSSDKREDYSGASICEGDLVRVQMAKRGRGHALGSHASTDVAVFLGYVAGIEYQGCDVMVTLKVRFPSGLPEPGPQRAIGLSKLMPMITHNRQMTALWRVNKLSDGLLHLLLHPKSYWKFLSRKRPIQKLGTPANELRASALDHLLKEGLNESQVEVIGETLKITESSATSDDASGAVLLQGPPGTGKTSTVLAILSVLLARDLGPQSERIHSRMRTFRCASGEKLQVEVAPFRILVCAPSNAAVDELLLRVMDTGLVMPSGGRACPRVLRVGKGSRDERVAGVTILELIERSSDFVWSDAPGRKKEARSPEQTALFLEQESMRRDLRQLSVEIGNTHNARKNLRAAHEIDLGGKKDASAEMRNGKFLMFQEQNKKLTDELSHLHSKKQDLSRKLTQVDQKVKRSKKSSELKSTLRLASLVNGASIVFATLNSAGHDVLSHSYAPFDAVILDEAAQSVEPDVLIPLAGANMSLQALVKRIILVGDPQQLPATVLSNDLAVVQGLSKSLFERLFAAKYSIVSMLRTQYRMHPAISRFVSEHFYGGRLQDGKSVLSAEYWRPYHFDKASRFGPTTLLDTSGCRDAFENKSASGSMANFGEARIVCTLLITLLKLYPSEALHTGQIAVLTPYKRQVAVILAEIGRVPMLAQSNIEVSTVDGIQGREKQFVVLSTVRGGLASRGIGFVKDEKRMNVAITRSRFALVVVGNAKSLSQGSRHWKAFVEHCGTFGRIRSVKSARDHFPEAFAGVSSRLLQPAELPPPESLPTMPPPAVTASDVVKGAQEVSDSESDWEEAEAAKLQLLRKPAVVASGRVAGARPAGLVPLLRRSRSAAIDFPLIKLSTTARPAYPQPQHPPVLSPSNKPAPAEVVPPKPRINAFLASKEVVPKVRPITPAPIKSVAAVPAEREDPEVFDPMPAKVTTRGSVGIYEQAAAKLDYTKRCQVGAGTVAAGRKRPAASNQLLGIHGGVPPPAFKRARVTSGPSNAERDSKRLAALKGAMKSGSGLASTPSQHLSAMHRRPTASRARPVQRQPAPLVRPVTTTARPAQCPPAFQVKPARTSAVAWSTSQPGAGPAPDAKPRTQPLPRGGPAAGSGRLAAGSGRPAAAATRPAQKPAGFSLLASSKALDKTANARRRAALTSKK